MLEFIVWVLFGGALAVLLLAICGKDDFVHPRQKALLRMYMFAAAFYMFAAALILWLIGYIAIEGFHPF